MAGFRRLRCLLEKKDRWPEKKNSIFWKKKRDERGKKKSPAEKERESYPFTRFAREARFATLRFARKAYAPRACLKNSTLAKLTFHARYGAALWKRAASTCCAQGTLHARALKILRSQSSRSTRVPQKFSAQKKLFTRLFYPFFWGFCLLLFFCFSVWGATAPPVRVSPPARIPHLFFTPFREFSK